MPRPLSVAAATVLRAGRAERAGQQEGKTLANYEEAETAINDAIAKMANRVAELTGGGSTSPLVDYATAINQMAEARAWLRTPNNSHGGGVAPTTSSEVAG